ncbi:DEAD/DEAH box helicase family protein [Polymorphospora rubra]|uniref:DNA-repair protein n=1 Tax=Polymorphospora rubra TaxID=338584 RepID=A0A810NC58_9ACTN|nr:DEAD/DEAH box helicase family protein [Polymorphospora rubra]BCJ69669.1 DNA-repair protein [Polymorphospora rubra]
MLKNLGTFATEYASDTDDIAEDFYDPCLRKSVTYDRITGFFSSTVFHLVHSALAVFFTENDGRMRLLCSPRLSAPDADSLLFGYAARSNAILAETLRAELAEMLDSAHAVGTRLLAALVASGRLEIKLARVAASVSEADKRMFHDKVGVFTDSAGDVVGFRGSLNESYLGLSANGNIESVDVWPSWEGGRDAQRAHNAVSRFARLWEGEVPGVSVVGLPDDIRRELERVAVDADLEALLRHLAKQTPAEPVVGPPAVGGIELRRHQINAFERWVAEGHRGLLAHATGSGKTVTGLYCAQTALAAGQVPLILVPSQLLLEQWGNQVRELLGARVVLAGGGHHEWSRGGVLRAAIESARVERPYAVVAVANTAAGPAFRSQVRPMSGKLFAIADEAHRFGSPEFRTILDWLDAPWRLGLSATPERAGDAEGTAAIVDYFGGIVHRYTLKDALDDGVLAPYVYHPSWVSLIEAEQQRWDALTTEIRRRFAIAKAPGAKAHTAEQLRMKLIERARLAKGAANKVPAAADLITQHYHPGQKWLVYCDNQAQLADVRQALDRRGIRSWEYHRQMRGDADTTLKLFDVSGGIVVAIKCLDEGVDIPSATHALILASSRNPREFIQRRGRVLRRSPHKTVATLLDVLVLPETLDQNDPKWSLAIGELARALQFANWGIGQAATSRLEDKWVSMGLSLAQIDELRTAGVETDDDDEGDPSSD